MANDRLVSAALYTAQVDTFTPANVAATNTFSVVCNGKTITYTAAGTTVAEVTAGLAALLSAVTDGEFADWTWTDNTTDLVATAKTPGKPGTFTSSASGGTASLTHAVATANSSPNDVAIGANWSLGAKPAGTNAVYIDATDAPLWWTLDTISGVAIASLTIASTYTGQIGLPERASTGNPTESNSPANSPTTYEEYRPQFLKIGAITGAITIGDVLGGQGSPLIKIDLQSNTLGTLNQFSSGTSQDPSLAPVIFKGGTITAANINGGSFDSCIFGGDTQTITTLKIGENAGTVRMGAGCTLTTVTQFGGTLTTNSAITTNTQYTGTHVHQAGAITTETLYGGTFDLRAGITITTLTMYAGSTFDLSNCPAAVTITNATLYGGTINDPNAVITFTNPASLPNGLAAVTINRGGATNILLS